MASAAAARRATSKAPALAETPCVIAVTGASGFIGSHVVDALLARGHTVRATVRDTADGAKTAHLTSE
jgi:NAD(P)-dependent dehydrogenase (short-subunit alcohol dehydrogenase family)